MRKHKSKRTIICPASIVAMAVVCFALAGVASTRPQWMPYVDRLLRPTQMQQQVVLPPVQQPTQPPKAAVDCTKVPCLALTFDDGPHPETTARLLDVLEREQVRATFFVVGQRVSGQEALLRRMFYAGDEIGNHTWSHPNLTTLSPHGVQQQVNQTQTAVVAAGVPAPTLLRPPYGAVNATIRSVVPMTIALWNNDPLDWKGHDAAALRDTVLLHARPGGVIDMHDIYDTTVQAMDMAIPELKKQYQLVTFSELMNMQPGQRGDYFGR